MERLRRAAAGAAVGRAAAARCAGARADHRAARAAARRAAVGARPVPAHTHARGAEGAAARAQHHVHPCHPGQDEAMALADLMVVMNERSHRQTGSPPEVFERPASAFVARFIGGHNVLPAAVARTRVDPRGGEGEFVAIRADRHHLAVRHRAARRHLAFGHHALGRISRFDRAGRHRRCRARDALGRRAGSAFRRQSGRRRGRRWFCRGRPRTCMSSGGEFRDEFRKRGRREDGSQDERPRT